MRWLFQINLPWFIYFVNCIILFLCGGNWFIVFLILMFILREENLDLLQHYQFSTPPFHFRSSKTREQLKWKTSFLPCLLQNYINLIILMPKFKAIIEGGQRLYTKNSTDQGIVYIQIWIGYRTRDNLVTWLPVDFYRYRAYLTTTHWPLKVHRYFNATTSNFVTQHPNLLSTLGLFRQPNEGRSQLPQDSEFLQFNVFNQILIPHLMGLLRTKAI